MANVMIRINDFDEGGIVNIQVLYLATGVGNGFQAANIPVYLAGITSLAAFNSAVGTAIHNNAASLGISLAGGFAVATPFSVITIP